MPPNSIDKVVDLPSGEVLLPTKNEECPETEKETRDFRTSFPQVLATMAQSMLLFSLGMLVSVPTVVIPAVTKISNVTSCNSTDSAQDGCLRLTDGEASTFAGVLLIMQPFGSLLAGVIQESVGRKLCMLLVNIPELIGWLLLYYASSSWHLYTAAVSLGFSIGVMEAPTLSYVGEIAQPHLRGVLASFTSVYVSVGTLLMYTMGTFLHWKTVMAISICVPVLTFIAILQIPESPVWLLLKGRDADATKSLCWLRGWTTPDKVEKELRQMQDHAIASKLVTGEISEKNPDGILRKPTLKEKLVDLMRPAMIQPLTLVIAYFFFTHCTGLNGARPYLVKVYTRLGVSINPFFGTVLGAISQIVGVIVCMLIVRRVGKRKLSLITMFTCSIINLCLGFYSLLHETGNLSLSWLPLVLMALVSFTANTGFAIIPWTLLSEVFPPRGRGVGGGLSAASFYVEWFIVTKSWPYLQSVIQLYGMFFLYSSLGFIGTLYLYMNLPETEGHSLEEIEGLFKKNRLRR
ncbi:facilitated trehalose transporter Tret1 isoform X1 [Halyomorpha halys]|uniref:facilitated trehalose transporter Tret1 isoform X1 n=1 Tax=Halyomorpha halys TaxID=286706 RepID=UPI0006D4FECD|nr:facilitated trehalose transporter Tret1-like isoform X1 [Halyomorpha halys]